MITGFTCGAFDLLHPGHVTMLASCRHACDRLIVGLHTDPSVERASKNKPVQSMYERYIQLQALEAVDEIIPYDTERDLENMFATLDINVRFIGSDHEFAVHTGETICNLLGIKIKYIPRLHTFSSTELRDRLITI